ncbi:hypothetical protein B5M42_018265 [Paenibacillus athensensis]|uniref:hypothetical protein n=1 Tax=Paenibacillus athensensis TaxID=1967502 RepID=UPI001431AFF8|nr:hypothetical protein [Paenibacillus athensensis]MCD1260750.1 hypothetical protein [Paenibacillus athensensis]
MSTSKNHQQAHGIGQIEQQLNEQAQAAEALQGVNETDREVAEAAQQPASELDETTED